MSLCLIVQKDTLEKDKVKSIVRACDVTPVEFVRELQTGHCIEYQLLSHTANTEKLFEAVKTLIGPFKTSFGRDWYDFDHETLSQIISIFLANGETVINFPLINSIMGFHLRMFPTVNKEIVISTISDEKEEIVSLLENLEKQTVSKDTRDRKDRKKK